MNLLLALNDSVQAMDEAVRLVRDRGGKLTALFVLAAALAIVAGWQHREIAKARAEAAQAKNDLTVYRRAVEMQAQILAAQRKGAENELRQVRQESQNAATQKLAELDRQRAAAVRESRGLRADFAAALAARGRACAAGAAAERGGADAGPPDRVLADVFGRVEEAADDIAGFADRLDIALSACQREHGAVVNVLRFSAPTNQR